MMSSNIVLIGMPTSGKSTVGVILAKMLGMDFVDTDLVIQRRTGKKLKDIIEEEGVEGFLRVEDEACAELEVENTVIATGGSVIYGEAAMKHLKKNSQVIYLEIDYDTLEKRLHHVKQRGVVLKDGQTKKELFDERIVLYKKYADIVISEDNLDIEETVQSIISRL